MPYDISVFKSCFLVWFLMSLCLKPCEWTFVFAVGTNKRWFLSFSMWISLRTLCSLLTLVCWAFVLILFVTFWWTIVSVFFGGDFFGILGWIFGLNIFAALHLSYTGSSGFKAWDLTSHSSISSCSWWVNTTHRLICKQLFILLELCKFTSVGLWMWQLNLYFYAAVLVLSLRLWRLFPPLISAKPKLK